MFTTLISISLCVLLAVMAWSVVAILRRHKSKMPYAKRIGCLMTLVGSFVGCFAISMIADAVWYRDFHYATTAEMKDVFLPKAARDITFRSEELRRNYRFKISENELRQWFDDFKAKYRDRSAFFESDHGYPDEAKMLFQFTGWTLPTDLKKIGHVMVAANGAGLKVWYSPGEGTAYCQSNSR